MTKQEVEAKMLLLASNKHAIEARLVAPAKAAFKAMKDAGMKATADPLGEILFEWDAAHQELLDLLSEQPALVVEVLISILERDSGK